MKKPKPLIVKGGGILFSRSIGMHALTDDEVNVIAQVINALRAPEKWPGGFAVIPATEANKKALESAH